MIIMMLYWQHSEPFFINSKDLLYWISFIFDI